MFDLAISLRQLVCPPRPITPTWWNWHLGFIGTIGIAISIGLTAMPWGLYYLLRWVAHGFSN